MKKKQKQNLYKALIKQRTERLAIKKSQNNVNQQEFQRKSCLSFVTMLMEEYYGSNPESQSQKIQTSQQQYDEYESVKPTSVQEYGIHKKSTAEKEVRYASQLCNATFQDTNQSNNDAEHPYKSHEVQSLQLESAIKIKEVIPDILASKIHDCSVDSISNWSSSSTYSGCKCAQ